MYVTEISWRITYIIISIICSIVIGIIYGQFMLGISLEAWTNEWEMDTMQYFHPNEIWFAYIKISTLISIWLVYPTIGVHIIVFIFNSLTIKEQKIYIKYWLASCILLFTMLYCLIKLKFVGMLMDLSHFDEDVEIVYVPNIRVYVNNWIYLMIRCSIVRQLPLIWIYICRKRLENKVRSRLTFRLGFLLPSLIRAIMIFDDIILEIIWVIVLRIIYLIILFICRLKENYNKRYK